MWVVRLPIHGSSAHRRGMQAKLLSSTHLFNERKLDARQGTRGDQVPQNEGLAASTWKKSLHSRSLSLVHVACRSSAEREGDLNHIFVCVSCVYRFLRLRRSSAAAAASVCLCLENRGTKKCLSTGGSCCSGELSVRPCVCVRESAWLCVREDLLICEAIQETRRTGKSEGTGNGWRT